VAVVSDSALTYAKRSTFRCIACVCRTLKCTPIKTAFFKRNNLVFLMQNFHDYSKGLCAFTKSVKFVKCQEVKYKARFSKSPISDA